MTRSLIAFLIALLALPAGAAAQRGGVFVDPETPAGTEYAIPLEEARRQGAGREKGGGGGGSGSQPLFGVGIERVPSGSAAGGESAGGGAGASGGGGPSAGAGESGGGGEGGSAGRDRRGAEGLQSARDRPAPVAVEAAARGGSDALLTAGIAGSVLAIGLLVGFGLRRLLRTE
jgi:hypothetical protein